MVFEQLLDGDEFNHFMILSCASRICSSSMYQCYQSIAEKMFKVYAQKYSSLYGQHTIGSNVHLLTHIVEDLKANNVGNLMDISTYRYENSLRLLGLKLKHGNLPLEQISRRIIETLQVPSLELANSFDTTKFTPKALNQQKHETTTIYQKVQITADVILNSKKSADSWFLTKNDELVKIKYAKIENNEIKILGNAIREKNAAFTTPLNSAKLKIFSSDGLLHDELRTYDIESIFSKMMCLPKREEFVYMPILHTMDSLYKNI